MVSAEFPPFEGCSTLTTYHHNNAHKWRRIKTWQLFEAFLHIHRYNAYVNMRGYGDDYNNTTAEKIEKLKRKGFRHIEIREANFVLSTTLFARDKNNIDNGLIKALPLPSATNTRDFPTLELTHASGEWYKTYCDHMEYLWERAKHQTENELQSDSQGG